MGELLAKIRIPCIFLLLAILNFRFLFTIVFNDRLPILAALTIVLWLLAIDYKALRREYLCWLAIFAAIILIDFNSYKINILTPLILMQCASTLDIRTYLRFNIIIMGITALAIFLFVGTGHMTQGEGLDFIRIRHDFGFSHPNAAMVYYWGIFISILLYCYTSRYRNFIWICLAIISVIILYLYTETVSRSFIIAFVIFAFVLIYYKIRSRSRAEYKIGYSRYILYALPILFTLLSVYFAVFVADYPIVDILLSGRPNLYKILLDSLTPLQYLLGTNIFDYLVIDSSYMHLLFEAGVLLFIYFVWLYIKAMRNIVKQQNFIVIAVFVGFLAYGLMESLLLYSVIISNNLFWVLMYKYNYGTEAAFDNEPITPAK